MTQRNLLPGSSLTASALPLQRSALPCEELKGLPGRNCNKKAKLDLHHKTLGARGSWRGRVSSSFQVQFALPHPLKFSPRNQWIAQRGHNYFLWGNLKSCLGNITVWGGRIVPRCKTLRAISSRWFHQSFPTCSPYFCPPFQWQSICH